MIREAAKMKKETRENMRGGNGSVNVTHIFEPDELTAKTRLFARMHLPAGASIGFHRHEGEEEVFYILSGRGIVDDDGTKREVGPGDAVLTGGGAGHAIEAVGDEPLEMVAVILKYS